MASQTSCDPCSSENDQCQAIKWCMDCQEAICKNCTISHRKIKILKSHTLVDLDKKVPTISFELDKCEQHPKFEEEYFCVDHDQTCCKDCLAKDHKACLRTMSLESASDGIQHSELLNRSVAKTSSIIETLNNAVEFVDENNQELETCANKIREEIDKLEANYIEQIKIMKRCVLDDMQKTMLKWKSELNENKGKASSIKTKVESFQNELRFVKDHGTPKQLFLFLRKTESKLLKCENDLESILLGMQQVNMSVQTPEVTIKDLWSVKTTKTECPIKYTPPKRNQAQLAASTSKLETFELIDRFSLPKGVITGMAVTDDNMLMACDRNLHSNSGGIQVFDQNNKLIKTIKMVQNDPWDITIIPNNSAKAVATFATDKLQFVDTKSLTPGKVVTFAKTVSGIASTRENIFVGAEGTIYVLSINGQVQRRISLLGDDYASYIHVDRKNRIHYSCGEKVKCLTADGSLEFWFKLNDENDPRNIATDLLGNLYVVGNETNQIVRLKPGGTLDRVILDKDNGINKPLALCFNKTCDKLYVSHEHMEILIYKCKR